MKIRRLATGCLALTMVLTTAIGLSGCANTKPAAEQITDLTDSSTMKYTYESNKDFFKGMTC